MERGMEPMRTATTARLSPATHNDNKQPNLDLDRLVWDPEYREAMRPWLKRAG